MPDLSKLHLGCGPHILPGFKNIDLSPGPGGIAWDIRDGIQEAGGSIDFIFTEHFIEHLDQREGLNFLIDCFRVLRPGGVLRISTPSLKSIVNDYRTKKLDRYSGTWEPSTPAQMINEAFHNWGHKFLYDIQELASVLYSVGFSDVRECDWRRSRHKDLMDLEVRPYRNDLIVEASK